MMTTNWLDSVLNALYPKHCANCGVLTGDRELCEKCRPLLAEVPHAVCDRCGQPKPLCECSSGYLDGVDAVRCAYYYQQAGEALLQAFKFQRQYGRYELLRPQFEELIQTAFGQRAQLVLAVPSGNWDRDAFQPSYYIAKRLAGKLGLPYKPELLQKVKRTPKQHGLTRRLRRDNLKGAFEVSLQRQLSGCSVLLVDDVVTTYATASECARTLKRAGANAVYVAALFKTPMNRDEL